MKKILLDLFRNSLWLKKLMIFEQIYRQILRAYAYIWSKNFAIKMPKKTILTTKWSFERGLFIFSVFFFVNCFAQSLESLWEKDFDLKETTCTKKTAAQKGPLIQFAKVMIKFHQKVISPADGPRSHFYPSSSQYALEAIQKHGFFLGVPLGMDRLMRENGEPWIYPLKKMDSHTYLKYDPVP